MALSLSVATSSNVPIQISSGFFPVGITLMSTQEGQPVSITIPTASQPIRTIPSASFPGMYVGQSAISNANLQEALKLALAQAPHAGSSLFSGPTFPLLDFNKGKKKLPSPQGTFPLNIKLIRRCWHFATFLDEDHGS
jgi:hypothetical protein